MSQINSKSLLTIKEARKLLGLDAHDMTDNDVQRTIILLEQIANGILVSTIVPNNDEVKNGK